MGFPCSLAPAPKTARNASDFVSPPSDAPQAAMSRAWQSHRQRSALRSSSSSLSTLLHGWRIWRCQSWRHRQVSLRARKELSATFVLPDASGPWMYLRHHAAFISWGPWIASRTRHLGRLAKPTGMHCQAGFRLPPPLRAALQLVSFLTQLVGIGLFRVSMQESRFEERGVKATCSQGHEIEKCHPS